jgi:hypothetical protein
MTVVKAQGEAIETVTIRLKQLKTSRSNPVQVLELPATVGWLCPVQAWKNWRCSRKANPVGRKPIFTWGDGSLVTLDNINWFLTVLLPGSNPRITTWMSALPSRPS